jgi:prefoldin subunit 5
MDLQSLWQLLQPYIAGRVRHLLVAIAAALVTKHIIQSDQQNAIVEIGFSVACYLAAEVWSVMATRAVPWLLAEKKRLENMLSERSRPFQEIVNAKQAERAQQQQAAADRQKNPPAPSVQVKP